MITIERSSPVVTEDRHFRAAFCEIAVDEALPRAIARTVRRDDDRLNVRVSIVGCRDAGACVELVSLLGEQLL